METPGQHYVGLPFSLASLNSTNRKGGLEPECIRDTTGCPQANGLQNATGGQFSVHFLVFSGFLVQVLMLAVVRAILPTVSGRA